MFSYKQHSTNSGPRRDISKDAFISCIFSFLFINFKNILTYWNSTQGLFSLQKVSPLGSSSLSGMKSTCQLLLFFFYSIIYCCWGAFLSKKRYLYITTIICSFYFFMLMYRLSRYFLIPTQYFDVKMAIKTRLLDDLTYPLSYLNCGFSLQASLLVCVVKLTISLSSTPILLWTNLHTWRHHSLSIIRLKQEEKEKLLLMFSGNYAFSPNNWKFSTFPLQVSSKSQTNPTQR